MGEGRFVVVLGMEEDLKGEVRVVLAGNEGGYEFRVETVGPGFDWWLDFVGIWEGRCGGCVGGDGGGDCGGESVVVVGGKERTHFFVVPLIPFQ